MTRQETIDLLEKVQNCLIYQENGMCDEICIDCPVKTNPKKVKQAFEEIMQRYPFVTPN